MVKPPKKKKPLRRKPVPIPVPAKLYHVTHPDCVDQILREGLKGNRSPRNRGETIKPSIFALVAGEDKLTLYVAHSQIWPNEDIASYAVLEIDRQGITGKV